MSKPSRPFRVLSDGLRGLNRRIDDCFVIKLLHVNENLPVYLSTLLNLFLTLR